MDIKRAVIGIGKELIDNSDEISKVYTTQSGLDINIQIRPNEAPTIEVSKTILYSGIPWMKKNAINFRKMTATATTPTRGSKGAAGWDLYADTLAPQSIEPGKALMVGTGIAMEIPEGYFGALYARSGLAAKRGLRPSNCVGVIDSDYRGEIKVSIRNDTDKTQTISPHERIAQLIVQRCESFDLNEVPELDETDRGSGGFGSTGA